MLVDAGPGDAGSTVISYLKSQGVSSLDVVVATHPHEDHIGGMLSVLDAFPVSLYVDNGATHTTKTYENLMNKLVSDATPYAEAKAGDKIPFASGITIDVLAPRSMSGDLNQDSLVLKVTDGNEKILLTGDAGDTTGDIQAQILKVAHHGSKYGTSLNYVERVNPEVAVISVGSGNDYGHPASSTITNVQSKGAKVYRTDVDGDVVLTTDGNSWSVIKPAGSSSRLTFTQPQVEKTSRPTPIPTVYIPTQAPIPVAPVVQSSSSGPCNCNGPDLDCKDFSSGSAAQNCYDYCEGQGFGDCFKLDKDKDGLACESL